MNNWIINKDGKIAIMSEDSFIKFLDLLEQLNKDYKKCGSKRKKE
jgi:hypothetical protein